MSWQSTPMYSIGQIAKMAGVSNRTLRYYEELGLISPDSRGDNRYRYYNDNHLRRLQTIKMLQESGFALKEIVSAFAPILDPSGKVTYTGQEMAQKIYATLGEQKNKLLERQKELTSTLEEIQKTMHTLVDCFGCKVSNNLAECAKCERGPGEVTHLGNTMKTLQNQKNASQNTGTSAQHPNQKREVYDS